MADDRLEKIKTAVTSFKNVIEAAKEVSKKIEEERKGKQETAK